MTNNRASDKSIVQARSGNVYNTNCMSDVGARNNMMVYKNSRNPVTSDNPMCYLVKRGILQNLSQNYAKEWYFGNLFRDEAQKLIMSESDGTYLIRDCNQIPGSFVLTVKGKSHSNKYVISPVGTKWKIGTLEFDSVDDILSHFSKNPIRLNSLTNPAPKHIYRVAMDYHKKNDSYSSDANNGGWVRTTLYGRPHRSWAPMRIESKRGNSSIAGPIIGN